MSWQTSSEVAFNFKFYAASIFKSPVFMLIMKFVGGIPLRRARRGSVPGFPQTSEGKSDDKECFYAFTSRVVEYLQHATSASH